jgi:hypothetical protein
MHLFIKSAPLTSFSGCRVRRPVAEFWAKYVTHDIFTNFHEEIINSLQKDAAQVTAASNRILEARISRNHDSISDTEQIPDTEGGVDIELRDVYFRYPTRDMSIFKGLNLHVSLSINHQLSAFINVLTIRRFKRVNLLLSLELQVCFLTSSIISILLTCFRLRQDKHHFSSRKVSPVLRTCCE